MSLGSFHQPDYMVTIRWRCIRYQELWQNNALLLQFWCLSDALTLRVHAFDASKSQRACIILSQFTCKSKYAVINLYLNRGLGTWLLAYTHLCQIWNSGIGTCSSTALPPNAGFKLACRSPLCRVITACCFMVTALAATLLWLNTKWHHSRVELKSTVCDLLQWAKWQGYRFIGKTLLAAWPSLCGKWCLCSCTNIIIKAVMRQAAKQHKPCFNLKMAEVWTASMDKHLTFSFKSSD